MTVAGRFAAQTISASFNGALTPPAQLDANGQAVFTVPAAATTGPLCVGQAGVLAIAPALTFWNSSSETRPEPFVVDGAPAGPARGCRSSQPIAFQSDRSGDYDIWAADPALPEAPVNLTRSTGAHDTAPAWSPTTAQKSGFGSEFDEKPLIALQSDRRIATSSCWSRRSR